MSTSEVSICNQALSWLGSDRIASLDGRSKAANLCKANYENLRDTVLESRMWTFATLKSVSEVQDKDPWGIGFAHPITEEYLGVFRVYKRIDANGNGVTAEDWKREGDTIVTKYEKVYIWGTKRISDTKKFPLLFVQVVAARIAAELCMPLTENVKQQAILWQLYDAKLSEAATRDGQQGANERVVSDTLVEARGRTT